MRSVRLLLAALVMTPMAAVAQETPREFKRIDRKSEEELVRYLEAVPEIGLDKSTATALYKIVSPHLKAGQVAPDAGPKLYHKHVTTILKKPELALVPWRAGADCQLKTDAAAKLQSYSRELRGHVLASIDKDATRPDAAKLEAKIGTTATDFASSECVPTILQMLQAEDTPIRKLLVKMLAKINGKDASLALAARALFDVSPEIRAEAVAALAKRPTAEYQHALLDGFRWPLGPVAEHAAEAIVALDLKSAVTEMKAIEVAERDPRLPFVSVKDHAVMVREVVKLNHMTNCMLCHAPSTASTDPARGRVPIPGQEIPQLYYDDPTGIFVRADVTYLRQDFSVAHRVAGAGKWPEYQRFDFVLRTRRPSPQEAQQLEATVKASPFESPSRRALHFALQQMGAESPKK